MADERLPLYEEVAARLLFDPVGGRKQGEANMHIERQSHVDSDWVESADMQLGEDADAWTGHTRENLPVTERPGGDPAWRPRQ